MDNENSESQQRSNEQEENSSGSLRNYATNKAKQKIANSQFGQKIANSQAAERLKLSKRLKNSKLGKKALNSKLGKKLSGMAGIPSIPTSPEDAAKQLAQEAAKKVIMSQAGNPIAWIVVIVILVIIIIVLLIAKHNFENQENERGAGSGESATADQRLVVDKTAPTSVNNGQTISYSIRVSYQGTNTVYVYDKIPEKTTFVSASGSYTLEDDPSGGQRIKWLLNTSDAPIPSQAPSGSNTTIDHTKYTQFPYFLPTPSGDSDIQYSDEVIGRVNNLGNLVGKHQTYLLTKVKNGDPKYVDPFLAVIWTGAIEGSYGNPYSWNCRDKSADINAGCSGGFYSGGWQVGGVQVSQAANHIIEDFNHIFGGTVADDANKVAEIGQAVITNASQYGETITNPSRFPNESLVSLVSQAKNGNEASQQALALLLMNPEINAVVMAREIAGDIASRDNWSGTMTGWSSWYATNMQKFSNRMKRLAELYSGEGGSQTARTVNQSFTLIVRPEENDVNITNQAWAEEVGGPSDSTGGNSPANSNTCDGYYDLDNPYNNNGTGANFGDPDCTLLTNRRLEDKDKLYNLLKTLDPIHADEWFFTIIPCEAPGYNPNTYASHESIGTPDPVGAWGLYQMGRGRNGEYDHGDVPWEKQTSNAINYNAMLIRNGVEFMYWECARYLWPHE